MAAHAPEAAGPSTTVLAAQLVTLTKLLESQKTEQAVLLAEQEARFNEKLAKSKAGAPAGQGVSSQGANVLRKARSVVRKRLKDFMKQDGPAAEAFDPAVNGAMSSSCFFHDFAGMFSNLSDLA
jgi:hypothetical protein